MSGKQLSILMLALGAVAVLLLQSMTAVPTAKRAPVPPGEEAVVLRPSSLVDGGMTPEQLQAEEALLDEQEFAHPVNKAAPEVGVVGSDGRRVRFIPARGRVTLVTFWATWCPPCVAELPSMLKLATQLERSHPGRFLLAAVSGDEGWAPVHAFWAKLQVERPKQLESFIDVDTSAARSYYCVARGYCPDIKFPESYVVDRNGRIVAIVVGPRDWSGPEARKFLESLIAG